MLSRTIAEGFTCPEATSQGCPASTEGEPSREAASGPPSVAPSALASPPLASPATAASIDDCGDALSPPHPSDVNALAKKRSMRRPKVMQPNGPRIALPSLLEVGAFRQHRR